MAVLQIECFLNEDQLSALTDFVSKHLHTSERSEMDDIDTCLEGIGIRLCVEFEIYLERIEIKQAEILDEDWNLIDADSAVLRSRLKNIVEVYNYAEQELTNKQRSIREEQEIMLLT